MTDNVLFDLDGTLTDPGEGITNSVIFSLEKFGISVSDRSELYKFIGPPLLYSYREYYGFSESDAKLALKYYREYFSEKGIFENRMYDGVTDMLGKLRENGIRLTVATSKPEPFAVKIIEHFGLSEYFSLVAGATMDEKRSEKYEVIEYALKKLQLKDKTHCIMAGDREHDIVGAKKNGLKSVGVLYGYGSREELENAGADMLAETPPDICGFILK